MPPFPQSLCIGGWVAPSSCPEYSAAQIYPNYAYTYYTLVFCVYAYVYRRIRVCLYARCLSCLTLSKKLYLRLNFIQIVPSYGKMLFLAPNNCASLTFFKEKLRVSARVTKSLAWTVFTCVEKMLSFSCVCCLKMGFEVCIPGSIWQRTVKFWLNGKNNLPVSQLIFCQSDQLQNVSFRSFG